MKHLDLDPIARAWGTVKLPGSKSISNRVLLLSALAQGDTVVRDLLDADDTQVMLDALARLGVKIEQRAGGAALVHGVDGRFPVKSADLHLGNAGTAFRPLAAVLALSGGEYRLSGVPRMHERPIGDLVEALRRLGADIAYLEKEGFPPLAIRPRAIQDGTARVRGDVSSQYLSALLMALPLAGAARSIEVEAPSADRDVVRGLSCLHGFLLPARCRAYCWSRRRPSSGVMPSQSSRTSRVCSPRSGGAVQPSVMSKPEYLTAGPTRRTSP